MYEVRGSARSVMASGVVSGVGIVCQNIAEYPRKLRWWKKTADGSTDSGGARIQSRAPPLRYSA
jgi:hypothetical protein